jgi:DNA-binding transcriptional regulator GbsR (MarR family)
MPKDEAPKAFLRAREEYLAEWGALGSAWGVNRTMSQIHALLMIAPRPLNTDEIMEELAISRGNAHANLKELQAWGLIRPVAIKGERKEHFEAEKDVWTVVQRIARARRRRELEPVLQVLERGLASTQGLAGAEVKAFRKQLAELRRFARLADSVMQRVGNETSGGILGWVARFLG